MIVTAGAGDRQAHEPARDHVDAIVDDVLLIVEEAPAERQEAHRRQRALVVAESSLSAASCSRTKRS